MSKHQHEGGTEREAHLTSIMLKWSWILKTRGCYQELKLGSGSCDIIIPKAKEGHVSLSKILFPAPFL